MKIAAILVFIAGLSSIFFETEHNPVSVRIFGAILSVAGTAIFIVAVWTMRDSWRAGVSKTDKTELVTNGIYQISRIPAFLGFDPLYIGTLLMFFNWILCFLTVFAVIMYHLQIVNWDNVIGHCSEIFHNPQESGLDRMLRFMLY